MNIGRTPPPLVRSASAPLPTVHSSPVQTRPAPGPSQVLGPRPTYPVPQPPAKTGLDISTPAARAQELAAIQDPQTVPRSDTQLATIHLSGPSRSVKAGAQLVNVMQDPQFGKILKHFSPSLGQRLLQAFGKSEGSIDGSRFKKNVARMLPLVNLGVYGKDAVRAQHSKKALEGIAAHAQANDNPLAQQMAEVLAGHEKSKRNTQLISGAVSVATTAVAFIPGTQLAPALTGASSALATNLGGGPVGALGLQYTAAAAIDSGIRSGGGLAVSSGSSTAQDFAVTAVDRHGSSVGKAKIGSGYGKLKVTTRADAQGQVKMESEMGYQAARALVNYLGPAQGADEAADSPRMQLRHSLGATDNAKSYSVGDDKKAQRTLASQMQPQDGRTDYLEMFFAVGVKGASANLGDA
ncbi:MAG: hypothetical protein ACO1RX_11645 [Candidatus Sericytochromatia bacterium]